MSFRRPLLVKRSADFDVVDQNLERFFSAGCIRDIVNVQELIPSRKRCGELPERIALDIAQRDIEVNELGVVGGCRHRDVALTDDLREVGVVAGVSTENQTQARILVRVHRRATGSNANAHDPFVRKKAIQVQLQLVGSRKNQHHRRNGWRLPGNSISPRHRFSTGKRNALVGLSIE